MKTNGTMGISGLDWLWIALAVVVDLATIGAAGAANRNQIPQGYPGSLPPEPPAAPPAAPKPCCHTAGKGTFQIQASGSVLRWIFYAVPAGSCTVNTPLSTHMDVVREGGRGELISLPVQLVCSETLKIRRLVIDPRPDVRSDHSGAVPPEGCALCWMKFFITSV